MVIFGDEDNMVERFVEIDARVFLEGTAHVASGFCWKTQKTRVFAAISLRSKVLTKGLTSLHGNFTKQGQFRKGSDVIRASGTRKFF